MEQSEGRISMERFYVWGISKGIWGIDHEEMYSTKKEAQEALNKAKAAERATRKYQINWEFAAPYTRVVKVFIEHERLPPGKRQKYWAWWHKHWDLKCKEEYPENLVEQDGDATK